MPTRCDLVIENTTIIDGTGAPAFRGCIGIAGEKIAAVGPEAGEGAARIDGAGLVTCPGFVDIHSHADISLLESPLAENFVAQGITTVVGGNCGMSLAPACGPEYLRSIRSTWGVKAEVRWDSMAEWLARVEDCGCSVNLIPLVGHNTVRGRALPDGYSRPASEAEIRSMEKAVARAMEEGAFGLSAGLDAAMPGHFASREELVRLLKVVRRLGGLFTPHTRHHQNQWPSDSPQENFYGLYQGPKAEVLTGRYHGLVEALELSRQADRVRLLIAHLTPAYLVPQPHPESLDQALAEATLAEFVDRPIREGLEVWFCMLPSPMSISSATPLLDSIRSGGLGARPEWLASLSREELLRKLEAEDFRRQLIAYMQSGRFKFGMVHPVTDPYWMDCFQVVECRDRAAVGRTIGELARSRAPGNVYELVYEQSFRTLFELLARDPQTRWAMVRDKREDGVVPFMLKHPRGLPCTDCLAVSPPLWPADGPGGGLYGLSPNAFGMFPYFLRRYVKDSPKLSLEEAVRRVTSLPAREVLGLEDRAVVKPGAFADLVVFDPAALREAGTFTDPGRSPEGIRKVIVNGTLVYENGGHTGKRPGRVLRRSRS